MRLSNLFLLLSLAIYSKAQPPSAQQLIQKVGEYYTQRPATFEYLERRFKSALAYDTSLGRVALVSVDNIGLMIVSLSPDFVIKNVFLIGDDYYILDLNRNEKTRIKKNLLDGTFYGDLEKFPTQYFDRIESKFGAIKSINEKDGHLIVNPRQNFLRKPISGALTSTLEVDPINFRITKLIQTASWKGNIQYEEDKYLDLPDSSVAFIKKQAFEIAKLSDDYTEVDLKDVRSRLPKTEESEGKSFASNKLVSLNHGSLEEITRNKYVILDFFYEACLPCHKMTELILNWLPSQDSSRIILIGIDPNDSDNSLREFIKNRNINYPLVNGGQAREIVRDYKVFGFPTLFLISPDGIIRNVHVGLSKDFLKKAAATIHH